MFNKKFLLIISLFILSISLISAISAADDDNATLTSDVSSDIDEDVISINDAETNEKISKDMTDEVLSISKPKYTDYTVKLYDKEITASQKQTVKYYVNPVKNTNYYSYYFNIYVFKDYTISDGHYNFNNQLYKSNDLYKSNTASRSAKTYSCTFDPYTFTPGKYVITAINREDTTVMDLKTLIVSDEGTLTADNFNADYSSASAMSVKLTDKANSKGIAGVSVKVVFSKGKTTLTKYYTTDSNGVAKFTPPLSAGTWSVTISPADTSIVKADALKRTATIKKASVSMKAYKVKEYKGFKVTLKATVKSGGKNVNEGSVLFKINGKTYKVSVKNGVATKKIKLKKVKTYKYTAKFTGDNYKSKNVKSKAVIKKRLSTKIVVKNQKVYSNDAKTFTVKVLTSNGKKVKDGKIKIAGQSGYVTVKNGKTKLLKYGLGFQHFKKESILHKYYKKTITKKFKLKYVPVSHKYKSSSKKVKVTSRFKCSCGKTGTHKHYYVGYYRTYAITIHVS